MTTSSAKRSNATANPAPTVHQFRIVLDGAEPPIWRSIQLPSQASFWDLHCAITDAMGWDDSHLHEFQIGNRRRGARIGIPMKGMDDFLFGGDAIPCAADWDVRIDTHFTRRGSRCTYLYDFGDGWSHEVKLEAILPREPKTNYPRCLNGARACPPEDCGSLPGYEQICAVLADPAGAEGEDAELLEWLGYYDPEAFDPAKVTFHSAARRLKALQSDR